MGVKYCQRINGNAEGIRYAREVEKSVRIYGYAKIEGFGKVWAVLWPDWVQNDELNASDPVFLFEDTPFMCLLAMVTTYVHGKGGFRFGWPKAL